MEGAAGPWTHLLGRHPSLRLLVLLGSRARGSGHAGSDWDVGLLGGDDVDPLAVRADVATALVTDAVDLVDLDRASAVLRLDAATDGRLLAEWEPGTSTDFQVEAISSWCDVEPVVRQAHADVLRAVVR